MPDNVPHSYTIATINLNGIHNQTKLQALASFVHSHDLDVVCMQEVVADDISIPGYTIVFNIDENRRGTAVATKNGIRLTQIRKSVDSRIICVLVENAVTVLNLYAPSGSNNRAARERFFSESVPFHLQGHAEVLILAGDCNAVTDAVDSTGSE